MWCWSVPSAEPTAPHCASCCLWLPLSHPGGDGGFPPRRACLLSGLGHWVAGVWGLVHEHLPARSAGSLGAGVWLPTLLRGPWAPVPRRQSKELPRGQLPRDEAACLSRSLEEFTYCHQERDYLHRDGCVHIFLQPQPHLKGFQFPPPRWKRRGHSLSPILLPSVDRDTTQLRAGHGAGLPAALSPPRALQELAGRQPSGTGTRAR